MVAEVLPVSLPQRDPLALLDQLTTGVGILDAKLHFIHANPAFIEITGLTRWRACPLGVLGDATETLHVSIQRMRATGSSFTLRDLALPAQSSHIDVTLSPWLEHGVLLELHARRRLDYEGASKISHTLRGLAHEVKNPLAGLRGAAQLLKRRSTDVDSRHLAELIIAEADRLGELADRLLHPGGKPHLSVVNLHEVAERACALIGAEAPTQIRLQRDYDPSLPTVRGDADRLLQLMLNLMHNAVEAQAKHLSVRTRAQHSVVLAGEPIRLALRVDITDDGRGVPDNLRDTLFLPLVSGTRDGSGIGLAVAQEIAHEHAGQLSFRSVSGETVFSLILPLESSRG